MLSDRFNDAFLLASELHRDHWRKRSIGPDKKGPKIPYLCHLLAVAGTVLEYGGDEETAMAAILHDAVEDRGGAKTLARIRERFGDRVADIVDEVSEDAPDEANQRIPWEQRKEAYLAGLPKLSPEARLVSAADKLANARSILKDLREIGEVVWDRFKKGKTGTLWFYRQIADIFDRIGPASLAAELDTTVTAIERFAVGPTDIDPLNRAIVIAAEAHSGKYDKGGGAYILHPLRVMSKQTNDIARIVAVLHDVVEDSDWTFDGLIAAGIPQPAIEALRLLTHDRDMPYDQYIDRLATNPLAKAVKLADLNDNLDAGRLKELKPSTIDRMNKYLDARAKLTAGQQAEGDDLQPLQKGG
ncbi:MAG: HD domain-containing protein [Phycisphaeraceae bacterium]|nr:HD domain-containing protein [Phycisphaeraceae bacterium]